MGAQWSTISGLLITKIMEASFMRETLRVGHYRLHDEGEVLKDRANARNRIKWLQTDQDTANPEQNTSQN